MILGPSGSGKTSLAQALLQAGRACGRFSSLVADDQVFLQVSTGRIVARAPKSIEGLMEVRGLGPTHMSHEDRAIIDLVVSLVPEANAPRMSQDQLFERGGVSIPMLALPYGNTFGALPAIAAWLRLPPFC